MHEALKGRWRLDRDNPSNSNGPVVVSGWAEYSIFVKLDKRCPGRSNFKFQLQLRDPYPTLLLFLSIPAIDHRLSMDSTPLFSFVVSLIWRGFGNRQQVDSLYVERLPGQLRRILGKLFFTLDRQHIKIVSLRTYRCSRLVKIYFIGMTRMRESLSSWSVSHMRKRRDGISTMSVSSPVERKRRWSSANAIIGNYARTCDDYLRRWHRFSVILWSWPRILKEENGMWVTYVTVPVSTQLMRVKIDVNVHTVGSLEVSRWVGL